MPAITPLAGGLARIAFIAVRKLSDTEESAHEAVVLGTNDAAGRDWRYAIFDLTVLTSILKDRINPFGHTAARYIPAGSGLGTPPAAPFDFSNIALFAAYIAPQDGISIDTKACLDEFHAGPLARIETIAFARDPDGKNVPAATVSRLNITPVANQPGMLGAFEFNLQVRAALNGHARGTGKESDRNDARIRFVLSATRGTRSLWMPNADKQPRGARCGLIRLGLTLRPWDPKDVPGNVAWADYGDRDLVEVAKVSHPKDPVEKSIDYIPLFDDLSLRQPSNWVPDPERVLGFRAVEAVAPKVDSTPSPTQPKDRWIRRIALRLELTIKDYSTEIESCLDPFFDDPSNLQMEGTIRFAQEQRLKDIQSANLEPQPQANWVLAIRIDPRNRDEISRQVVGMIDRHIESVHSSLRRVRDREPLSAVPRLTIDNASKDTPWHAVYLLTEQTPWRRYVLPAVIPSGFSEGKLRTKSRLSFEPVFYPKMWVTTYHYLAVRAIADPSAATCTMRFDRLVATNGRSPEAEAHLTAPAFNSIDAVKAAVCTNAPAWQPAVSALSGDVEESINFGIAWVTTKGRFDIVLGAFGFSLQQTVTGGRKQDLIGHFSWAKYERLPAHPLDARVSAVLKFPVEKVLPAGQDDLPEVIRKQLGTNDEEEAQRRPLVLLLDEQPPKPDAPVAQTLVATETYARNANQSVDLSLRTIKEDAAKTDVAPRQLALVIEPEPFRIAAVGFVDPARTAGNERNEVATWNAGGEGGQSWQILDPSQSVRVLLPPQVIGEAMEKTASTIIGAPQDIARDRTAAARFGSPGRLDFDPTFFDKDYREPGWNLRRTLGNPTQRPPGSRLNSLRLELLYGMTARVDTSALSVDTFISEIGATIGAPVRPFEDSAGSERHIEMTRNVLKAERRRLAVDKIWSGRPDAELKIESGLAFRLRERTGDVTPDGSARHGPATKLRWPVAGDVPKDTGGLIDAERLAQTFSTVSDDAESFPGGVAWAFESGNILMKVYARPDTSGGWLKGLHISSLGGYGGQRALFDQNKTIIESETTQGRLHRYKLERVGRIGGLWNRAKHVIVYERTVVPSAQFYNGDPIGKQQDEHAGRPILRKVEEYVDLLQPVRRYPEDGSSVTAAGFLVGAEFKSTRIRVDSRWGGDVRREGWQVPLWNKAFAKLAPFAPVGSAVNPDDPALIYPKPQIRFLLASASGGTVAAEIAEPEKLVFYTSVLDGDTGDDTDLWRPVRDIDFVDLPAPVAGRVKPRSEGLTDAILPAEPANAPGFEKLTIGLLRTEEAATPTYGRTPTGPGTIFKNVTISRSAPVVSAPGASSLPAFGRTLTTASADLRAAIDAKVGEALGALERLDQSELVTAVSAIERALARPDFLGDINTAASNLKASVDSALPDVTSATSACEALTKRLREAVDGQVKRLRLIADAALDDVLAQALEPLRSIAGTSRDVSAYLTATAGWLSSDERAALIEQFSGVQDRIAKLSEEVKAEIESLAGRAVVDLETLSAVAGASLGNGQAAISAAIREVSDQAATLSAALANATVVNAAILAAANLFRQKIRDALPLIDRAVEGIDDPAALVAVRRILPALHAKVGKALTLTALKIGDAISQEIKDSLTAVTDLTGALDSRLGTVGGSMAGLRTALDGMVTAAKSHLEKVVDGVEKLVDELTLDAIGIFEAIADAIIILADEDDPDDTYDPATALVSALKALTTITDTIETEAKAAAETIVADMRSALDRCFYEVQTARDALAMELKGSCEQFDNFIRDNLKDVGDWLGKSLDLEGYKSRLQDEIKAAIQSARSIEEARRRAAEAAAKLTREVESRARQIAGAVNETLRDTLGSDPATLADRAARIYQEGSNTLRVLRAVGDPPKVDRLGFNRPEVAYVLAEANKIVDMTPALALVNRVADTAAAVDQAGKAVGDMLQSFGVRLPSSGLGEQFIPDKLKQLSVADLIPDMGGIDFRGLLQRVAFPDLDDAKAIAIRHGFDPKQMRGWMEAEIDVPFTEPTPLISFGPVEIIVDDARFNAKALMSTGRDGTRKTITGRIFGDWRVVAGGQDILTFLATGLYFDDTGKIDFRIDPERIELADALEFLTNILATCGKGDGLVVEPLMRGPIPAGVAATLDLQLPDVQLGVFGISNLSLHVMFGIAAIPEFEIICEASLATKTLPFTLNVWILNGGGFLTQRLSFLPVAKPKPLLTYSLEIGIVAGVGLGFSFGIVSGGVWLQVGCSITMTWSTGAGGNTTAISVFILARGNVDVAGLITAAISLLLEVTYDGSLMVGSGTLRLSFKISMFYTLRVCQHVEYVFAGEKKPSVGYSDSYA